MSDKNTPFRSHRAILLLSIASITWFGMVPAIEACSCITSGERSYFVTGDQLPANARGVLFISHEAEEFYLGNLGSQADLVTGIPAPLTAKDFTITEGDDHKILKAVVERLHAVDQIDTEKPTRHLRILDPLYEICFKNRYDAHQDARCADKSHNLDYEAPLEPLLSDGKLEDVTAEFDKTEGLFRVGPANGFQVGKTYHISFNGRSAKAKSSKRVSNPILVTITEPIILTDQDRFTLELRNEPRREMLSLATGGSCSQLYPLIVQDLEYSIPAAFVPYRSALRYFTMQQSPGTANGVPAQRQGFERIVYRPNMCGRIPFGGSVVGVGREMAMASCESFDRSAPVSRVKGYVGFLEVDDKLYETPSSDVDFDRAKGNSCDGFSFLKQAIADHNQDQIRKTVCDISHSSEPQVDPKQFLPTLTSLTDNKDPVIRDCAESGLVSMINAGGGPDPQAVLAVAPILITNLNDADNQVKITAAGAIANLVNEIRTRIQETGTGAAAARELNLTALLPAVPVLTNMVIDPHLDMTTRHHAEQALTAFGPQAQVALPTLLNYHGDLEYSLPSLLVAIDPQNPQVFEYLMPLARRNVPVAIDALGLMGKYAGAGADFLFEQAISSDFDYVRESCMAALVRISDDDQRLVKAITLNLSYLSPEAKKAAPETRYLRQHSIQTLGVMGPRAKTAVPQLMAVLDTAPTFYEYYTLITVLRQIDAPMNQVDAAIRYGQNSTSKEIRDYAKNLRF